MPLTTTDKLRFATNAAEDKKARDIVILHLKEWTAFTDYFFICTGDSPPQIKAIVENIEVQLKKHGERPLGIEGSAHRHWVLMDYNDVIVHVFDGETRMLYNLEKLWIDVPRVNVESLSNRVIES